PEPHPHLPFAFFVWNARLVSRPLLAHACVFRVPYRHVSFDRCPASPGPSPERDAVLGNVFAIDLPVLRSSNDLVNVCFRRIRRGSSCRNLSESSGGFACADESAQAISSSGSILTGFRRLK